MQKTKQNKQGHNKFVTALAVDNARNQVYTGSYDSLIIKWDVATGSTQTLSGNGHTNQIQVSQSSLSPKVWPLTPSGSQRLKVAGDTLVSAAMDDSIRFSHIGSTSYGDAVSTDSPPQDIAVNSRDSSLTVAVTLKVGSSRPAVLGLATLTCTRIDFCAQSVLVLRNGRIASTLNVNFQPTSVAISPNGRTVTVGGKDNKVHVYDLNGDNLSESRALDKHRGEYQHFQ